MRTQVLLGAALLLGAACHHHGGGAGGGSDVDSLWELAPDATLWGVVANPRAIGYATHVLDHVRVMADDPELVVLHRVLDRIDGALGGPTHHLADIGFAGDRGFAIFDTAEGIVLVLPVGDRDKLIAALHGERGKAVDHLGDLPCKPIKNVYACATTIGLFDRMGKGKLRGRAEAAGARGDLEAFVKKVPVDPSFGEAFLTASLDDGTLSLHGFVAGMPPALAALASVPRPRVDTNRMAGFIAINLGPALAMLPPLQLPGIKADQLVHSIRGPVVAMMGAVTNDLDVHVPLVDPGPFESLVSHCGELAALLPITAKPAAGACHITLTTPIALELELWVENKELRIATHKATHPLQKALAVSPVGNELAGEDWTYAAWGHGSLLAPGITLPARPDEPVYNLMLRAMAQVNEAGVGIKIAPDGLHARGFLRTIWANPLDMASKLAAVSALELTSGRAAATGQKLAYGSPGSPFADDFAAGQAGMLAPVALFATTVLPTVLDYIARNRKTEAELELTRLGKNLKFYYNSNGAFPVADVPLTPARSCCEENFEGHRKCGPEADIWRADPAWQALDFEIDEPHLYQYSYQSDGSSFTATAVGDLDCDKVMITYTLVGTTANGNVQTILTTPPPNAD